jgi:putative acetyltransferase
MILRQLALPEMDEAARVHRRSFDQRLSWLAGLHTPAEDMAFFREHVYAACKIWGSFSGQLTGFIAFRQDWIDLLYVLPEFQGRGAGSALLDVAKSDRRQLNLWTFQQNIPARRFYETRGFRLVRETDGADNEEREPDCLYQWQRHVAL